MRETWRLLAGDGAWRHIACGESGTRRRARARVALHEHVDMVWTPRWCFFVCAHVFLCVCVCFCVRCVCRAACTWRVEGRARRLDDCHG